MTLSTYIRTDAPVSPVALLDLLTVAVGGDPATTKRECWWEPEKGEIGNDLGQGYAAIVVVKFGLDGPLREEYFDYSPDPEDADEFVAAPTAAVSAWLDTAYGYRGDNGENCEDLHRRLAAETAEWVRGHHPGARVWFNIDMYGEWWEII